MHFRVGAGITLPETRADHTGPSNLTDVDSIGSGGPAPRWAVTAAASGLEPGCRVWLSQRAVTHFTKPEVGYTLLVPARGNTLDKA